MAQQPGKTASDTLVPLRKWIESEDEKNANSSLKILRKATVAYALAELFRRFRAYFGPAAGGGGPCEARNFAVRMSCGAAGHTDIVGVDALSPALSVRLAEPAFLRDGAADEPGHDDLVGRYLEAEFTEHRDEGTASSMVMFCQNEEDARCHALGHLLHELFSPRSPPSEKDTTPHVHSSLKHGADASRNKKMRLVYSASESNPQGVHSGVADGTPQTQMNAPQKTTPLLELGIPASISLLVQNLIECHDEHRPENAYESLDGAVKDLHLVLLDPCRFLFHCAPPAENGVVPLSFREHKLYGREKEMASITDAFCRVSGGKIEAFFVGGFSGSGKSRLVNSLTARIDIAEGYVLTHKFDQLGKDNQLLDIISLFNDLCLLVVAKRTQREIEQVSRNLADIFGRDLSLLAKLLPNVRAFFPGSRDLTNETGIGDQMNNLHATAFILRRFMGCVSSSCHPVMYFLDDLQWSESAPLAVLEEILTGTDRLGCLFFVGSYRDNEVSEDHALCSFMRNLSSRGIRTTRLKLEGLKPTDFNTMISDALCMFPRICEPLSDIVFHKTKGNPFFALRFLKKIVDDKLLEYSSVKRCWVWDEDRIGSMDVTGNVLVLLVSKMSELSENVQVSER